jgi:tRNA-specific 2-thiouridylase
VAVGLSGGVDSSVTAVLLQEQGFEVIGLTMEIFDGSVPVVESARHACYGPGEKEDVEKAAALCDGLGIPYHTLDLRNEFRNIVLAYFREEYLAGRTPNPCILCNHRLKFGFLLEKAREARVEFDYFATGHYARIAEIHGRYVLKKAADASKDQTYFLYGLKAEQLARTLFPLGEYQKSRVREMARSYGLEVAEEPESQDFIAGGDYAPLFSLEEIKKGEIVDTEGRVLGEHRGIIHYTIGQRRGLGIAADRPLYVVEVDPEKNRIIVGGKERLFADGLVACDLNLLAVEELDRPRKVLAKIRFNHKGVEAEVIPLESGRVRVMFKEPQMSVTPGQSVVFYQDDIVFGGGIIEKAV